MAREKLELWILMVQSKGTSTARISKLRSKCLSACDTQCYFWPQAWEPDRCPLKRKTKLQGRIHEDDSTGTKARTVAQLDVLCLLFPSSDASIFGAKQTDRLRISCVWRSQPLSTQWRASTTFCCGVFILIAPFETQSRNLCAILRFINSFVHVCCKCVSVFALFLF